MSVEIKVGDVLDLKTIGVRGFNLQELARAIQKTTICWSWGAHAWKGYSDQWLRFKSEGHHHKGHVYITLAANDTFTIYYTTTRGKVVDIAEDIYVDVLIDTIDTRIEKIDEYIR